MSMTGLQLQEDMRLELGRPDDDDLFDPDGDARQYYSALTHALGRIRRKISEISPEELYEEDTQAADDSTGDIYTLTDNWIGEIEIWAPPGVGRGLRILPGEPGRYGEQRFWLEGMKVKLAIHRVYTPGIYIRWIPETVTPIDEESTGSGLAALMDQWLVYDACAELARRPGSNLDRTMYEDLRDEEWFGKRRDPSDTGILGTLTRRAYKQGIKHLGGDYGPWWAPLQS